MVKFVVVTHIITDEAIQNMPSDISIAISIRLELNKHGFKFEDDGKPSLIANTDPIPLGKFTCDYDAEFCRTRYNQAIE